MTTEACVPDLGSNYSSIPQLAAMALTVDQLVARSGINDTMGKLLKHRGMDNINLMYHLLEKAAQSDAIVDQLGPGVKVSESETLKLDATDIMVQKAALRAAWDLMDQDRATRRVATPMAAPTPTPATSTEKKVPKTLPAGYWTTRIKEYNDITVDGRARHFPVQYLTGAEEALARMVYEHQESKMYTAPSLTEIVCNRDMTATGEPNPWAQNKPKTERQLLPDENGVFTELKKKDPEAYSAGLLLEGIETTRWALIFARWSSEHEIDKWISWWTKTAKDNPDKNWQIRQFWTKAHQHLTTALRGEEGFPAAAKRIMESHMLAEALSKTRPNKGTGRGNGNGNKGNGRGNGRGGKGGKGAQKRKQEYEDWSPAKRSRKGRGHGNKGDNARYGDRPQDRVCHFFAKGHCQKGTDCPFAHVKVNNNNVPPPPPGVTSYNVNDKGKGGKNGGKGKY